MWKTNIWGGNGEPKVQADYISNRMFGEHIHMEPSHDHTHFKLQEPHQSRERSVTREIFISASMAPTKNFASYRRKIEEIQLMITPYNKITLSGLFFTPSEWLVHRRAAL